MAIEPRLPGGRWSTSHSAAELKLAADRQQFSIGVPSHAPGGRRRDIGSRSSTLPGAKVENVDAILNLVANRGACATLASMT